MVTWMCIPGMVFFHHLYLLFWDDHPDHPIYPRKLGKILPPKIWVPQVLAGLKKGQLMEHPMKMDDQQGQTMDKPCSIAPFLVSRAHSENSWPPRPAKFQTAISARHRKAPKRLAFTCRGVRSFR